MGTSLLVYQSPVHESINKFIFYIVRYIYIYKYSYIDTEGSWGKNNFTGFEND